MFPSVFQHILAAWRRLRGGDASFLAGLRLPGGMFAQMRCTRRIDATAQRVAAMGTRIGRLSGRLYAGSIPGVVDADRSLRHMLGELRDDLGAMRRDLAQWHVHECHGRAGARLEKAIAHLNRVAADTGAAAERLVRQIEEYDAPGAG